jgi:hypothetical protein
MEREELKKKIEELENVNKKLRFKSNTIDKIFKYLKIM